MLQAGLDQNNEAQAAYAESILRLKQLTEQHPTKSEYFLELGKACYGRGRLSRWWLGSGDFLRKLKLRRAKLSSWTLSVSRPFISQQVSRNLRKLHEAVADAEITIQLDPNNPSWHIQLAFLLWTVEDPHIKDFNHALRHGRERSSLIDVIPEPCRAWQYPFPRWGNVRLRWQSIRRRSNWKTYTRQGQLPSFPNWRSISTDTKGIIEHAEQMPR